MYKISSSLYSHSTLLVIKSNSEPSVDKFCYTCLILLGSSLLGHLVSRLFTERNIHLRGIAHPFMFDRDIELIMPDSSSFDGIRLMGAVPTSPANFYKLLLRKSSVLLYCGGTREALHRKVINQKKKKEISILLEASPLQPN
ncbi:neutral/alkaline invertase 1, mitochondrial-like [Iris pallida]|uniref:Neutral/alkaline invertase 1, mitochondrial-like n=1 Tax=Iris pallida TaxID=29817 RepID=A0AAX6IGG7_IRIPA|nr:neutral/alkaline invertase 1, mitochondrial-like [Iris pallida]